MQDVHDVQEFRWIPGEKHLFGRPGGDYDWSSCDPKAAEAQYLQVKQEQGPACQDPQQAGASRESACELLLLWLVSHLSRE